MALTLGSDGITSSTGSVTVEGTGALRVSNGTTPQRPTAEAGMIRYNTTTSSLEGYIAGSWIAIKGPFIVSGGTETTVGSDTVLSFTSTGTMTVTNDGDVSYLVVGGGGGGGGSGGDGWNGGGGGAGGMRTGTLSVTSGSYTVTVGSGGSGGTSNGPTNSSNKAASGGSSTLVSITSVGGGGGGAGKFSNDSNAPGAPGGSGGGAGFCGSAGSGTPGQGSSGGSGGCGPNGLGAAGGGAGATGCSECNGNGTKAAGVANNLRTGSNVTYAEGGGTGFTALTSGPANSGDGGCGRVVPGGTSGPGGAGGSGIVVVRYTP